MENNFFSCIIIVVVLVIFVAILAFALLGACFCGMAVKDVLKSKDKKAQAATETKKDKDAQKTVEEIKSIYSGFIFFALVVAACFSAFVIYHTQKCIIHNNELNARIRLVEMHYDFEKHNLELKNER